MGYTTNFIGKLSITPPVQGDTLKLLKGLNKTRRMKRNVGPKYGVEGEFYIKGDGEDIFFDKKKQKDSNIVDFNTPPSTQPGLWCQWEVNDDGDTLQWDAGEKFKKYVKWLEYLIEKVFKPKGHVLEGKIEWEGEESADRGIIVVENNDVKTKLAHTWFLEEKDALRITTLINSFLNSELKELIDDSIDRKTV
jgi:hypothetical protein